MLKPSTGWREPKVDVGLLVAVPDYQQRKRHLEWYKLKMEENAN